MPTTLVSVSKAAWTRVALAADTEFTVTCGRDIGALEGVFTDSDAAVAIAEGHIIRRSVNEALTRTNGAGDLHVRIDSGNATGNAVVTK